MGEIIISQQGFEFIIKFDGSCEINCERGGTLDLDKQVAIKSIKGTPEESNDVEIESKSTEQSTSNETQGTVTGSTNNENGITELSTTEPTSSTIETGEEMTTTVPESTDS